MLEDINIFFPLYTLKQQNACQSHFLFSLPSFSRISPQLSAMIVILYRLPPKLVYIDIIFIYWNVRTMFSSAVYIVLYATVSLAVCPFFGMIVLIWVSSPISLLYPSARATTQVLSSPLALTATVPLNTRL